MKFHDLIVSLREGKFTSIGCYPKFYYTKDGGVLSHEAVLANLRQIDRAMNQLAEYPCHEQWCVVGAEINYENPSLYCEDTNERIESAYAEDKVKS